MKNESSIKRNIAFFTPMVLYMVFIVVFLVTRFLLVALITKNPSLASQYLPRQYNLVPFQTVMRYLNNKGQWNSLDVVGNILLLVPMGIYIHALFKKKRFWKSALMALLMIVLIESAQFILATGSFDIDDIIMNFIGALIGILTFQLIYQLCKKDSEQSKTVLSAISITLIPILVATVVEYALWFPYTIIIPVGLVAFVLAYWGLYVLFYRYETKTVKTVFIISCLAMCALFFFFVLPMLLPGAGG